MKNIYAIRKGILRALKDCTIGGKAETAAPMSVEDLISLAPMPEIMYASPEDVKEEWNNLRAFKYIEAIPGFEGKYCRITEKGLQQLSIEFSQDVFVHGPGAIK